MGPCSIPKTDRVREPLLSRPPYGLTQFALILLILSDSYLLVKGNCVNGACWYSSGQSQLVAPNLTVRDGAPKGRDIAESQEQRLRACWGS